MSCPQAPSGVPSEHCYGSTSNNWCDCNLVPPNSFFQQASIAGLPIGGSFQHPTYCEDSATGDDVCCDPGNGEWGLGTQGSPCECTHGDFCGEHGGCPGICTRINYSGDPTICCQTGSQSYIDNGGIVRTCDPNYTNYATGNCDAIMGPYCSQGNNLFGNACSAWVIGRNSPGSTGSSTVDSVVTSICQQSANLNAPQCQCVNAAVTLANSNIQYSAPAQCILAPCVGTASSGSLFKTSNLLAPCTGTYCVMDLQNNQFVSSGGQQVVNYNQQCGPGGSFVPAPPGTQLPPSSAPGSSSAFTWSALLAKYWIWIIILVAIVVILIGLALYFGLRK